MGPITTNFVEKLWAASDNKDKEISECCCWRMDERRIHKWSAILKYYPRK